MRWRGRETSNNIVDRRTNKYAGMSMEEIDRELARQMDAIKKDVAAERNRPQGRQRPPQRRYKK